MQIITKKLSLDCNNLKHISLHESVEIIELQLTVQNLSITVDSCKPGSKCIEANKEEVWFLIR
jgi:hypothetical protein